MSSARLDADVVIIGAGFGGTLLAMALCRQGRSVILVERGRHPRFAIGESSTPLANLLLEELAATCDLPRVASLSKWGTWRRAHPDLPVGLKRGFTFFHHAPGAEFQDDSRHANQLMVAASPHDEIADTHWYRPAFDAFLAKEAQDAGADLLDLADVTAVRFEGDTVALDITRHETSRTLTAGFLVDASGPRGALHRLFGLADGPTQWLPPTEALYAHFEGVDRWDQAVRTEPGVPYPVDDAALHQVFPGGWIWVLRFDNGITSAGAALTAPLARALAAEDGAPAWLRLLDRLPSVKTQFQNARPTMPFVHARRLAYRADVLAGERWAMLPSAAGVIDPLLSTGFPLTLLGVIRLAGLIERTGTRQSAKALDDYAQQTRRELDATERLVAALYACMDDFDLFKRLSRVYFAAASFSEAARRLGRPHLAPGFLLCDHPLFGPASRAITEAALMRPTDRARANLCAEIDRIIEPFDVAGLGDASRSDWFPVLADDLLDGREKLHATEAEIDSLLERCGFSTAPLGGRRELVEGRVAD